MPIHPETQRLVAHELSDPNRFLHGGLLRHREAGFVLIDEHGRQPSLACCADGSAPCCPGGTTGSVQAHSRHTRPHEVCLVEHLSVKNGRSCTQLPNAFGSWVRRTSSVARRSSRGTGHSSPAEATGLSG